MFLRFLWSVGLLVVVLVHDAQGRQVPPPDSARTVVMDEVTVEAERPEGPDRLLRPGRLQGVADLAGLISGAGGLDLRQYGANGSAHLALRGLPSGHTEIFLDGIPLTHPQTGQVDLSLLPMVGVRSAVVSGGLGDGGASKGGGLGGGVRLTTGSTGPGVAAQVVAGSWGERRYALEAAAEGLGGRGMLAWQGVSAPGSFPYQDPYALHDAGRTRDGAGRSSQSFMAQFSTGDRVRSNVLAWWTTSQRGLPGPVNSPSVDAWQSTTLKRLQATVESSPGPRGLRLRMESAWTEHTLAWRDPSARFGGDSDLQAASGFLRIQASRIREWSRSRLVISPTVRVEHDRARQAEWRAAAGVTTTWTTANSHVEGFLTAFSAPGGGISASRDVGANGRVRAALGRSVRLPTLADRYWVPGGNPDIRPEHGWTGELGIDVRNVAVTAFRTRVRDQIIWRPKLAGAGTSVVQVYTPENVGRVVSRGVEVRVGGQWVGRQWPAGTPGGAQQNIRLTWMAHGTVTSAVDRSHAGAPSYGHQVRYTPSRMAGGWAQIDYRDWNLNVTARHTGRRFITADETQWLAPQTSVDIGLARMTGLPGARMRTWISLNNVFDAHLEGMRLYPMPPRNVQVGFRFSTQP